MSSKATKAPWVVTPEKVEAAIRRIVELAHPRQIVLFGSYVRGQTNIHSDVDFLVVVADPLQDARKESVRLQRALRDILMPVDILVVPESQWEACKDEPGLIFKEAWTTGKIVYGS